MSELPLAPVRRLMEQAKAERISDDAVKALRDEVEERARALAERARDYAHHADRRTVQRGDVQAARR